MVLGILGLAMGLPQLFFLRLGEFAQQPLFHGGGILNRLCVTKLIAFIGPMASAKSAVIIIALIFASWFQWRFFVALCSLFLPAVFAGLTVKTSAGYDFLTFWS